MPYRVKLYKNQLLVLAGIPLDTSGHKTNPKVSKTPGLKVAKIAQLTGWIQDFKKREAERGERRTVPYAKQRPECRDLYKKRWASQELMGQDQKEGQQKSHCCGDLP